MSPETSKGKREERLKNTEHNIQGLKTIPKYNIRVTGIPEGDGREKGTEK